MAAVLVWAEDTPEQGFKACERHRGGTDLNLGALCGLGGELSGNFHHEGHQDHQESNQEKWPESRLEASDTVRSPNWQERRTNTLT